MGHHASHNHVDAVEHVVGALWQPRFNVRSHPLPLQKHQPLRRPQFPLRHISCARFYILITNAMLALRVSGGVVAAYFRGEIQRATALRLRKVMRVSTFDGMTLIVPDGTTGINRSALEALGFRHVVLPRSLRYLRAYSFRLNLSLVEVVVPPNCEMQNDVFSQCAALKEARIGQCDIISAGAFRRCPELETVHLVGVRQILSHAFEGCSSLRSISLPDTVNTIGTYAFKESGVESFEFPPLVQKADGGCFFFARKLRRVDLRNVKVIESSAFSNSQLLSVSIPTTVSWIKHHAFAKAMLQGVDFQEGGFIHLYIDATAFAWTRLQTVVLPRRVRLDSCTFYECAELEVLQFHPDSECNATVNMCFGCVKLRSVRLPRRLTIINDRAFRNCKMLSNINIGDTDLERIGVWAFRDCTSIRDVMLPEQVEEIQREAFRNSGVHRVTGNGPNALRIGTRAFCDCDWLYTATFDYGAISCLADARHPVANQFAGCTRLQALLMPNNEPFAAVFYVSVPTLRIYASPSAATLRAAAAMHTEWWRRMSLLGPELRRSAYHLLWVLRICCLPRLVAVKIVRSLHVYDLKEIGHL